MKRNIKIIILFVIAILLMSGCSNKIKDNDILVPHGDYRLDTLKQAGGTDWGMSNPYLQDPRGPGTAKVKLVFDSLLEEDEEGIIPWLAKEWVIEGNTYRFTIADNSYFHNGKLVTTEDIAFSLNYYEEFPPINNFLSSNEGHIVESYEVIDGQTIEINVRESFANTLTKLGSFLILPKDIWENIDDPYTYMGADAFIGSGPYQWGQYDPSTGSYEFIAFDKYYGYKPVAERVLFVPVSDPILDFENREIDITSVPADIMDRYKEDSSIGMISKDDDMGYKLLLNMEKLPEFTQLELRRAVYHAIDRQAIVDKVFRGLGSVGSAGYVPVTSMFYNSHVVKYNYDIKAAKDLLANKDIEVELLSSNSADDVKISQLIKNDLEAVGMKVNVLALMDLEQDI